MLVHQYGRGALVCENKYLLDETAYCYFSLQIKAVTNLTDKPCYRLRPPGLQNFLIRASLVDYPSISFRQVLCLAFPVLLDRSSDVFGPSKPQLDLVAL